MSNRVVEPSPIIVEFYYYFSYFTFVLCWLIAPLLFYVILTQSKKLTSFKWLILNHSFWCLALETLLALVKPLFMSPCAGGIQIGILRDYGNFRGTAIAALICLAFTGNCVLGVTFTIGARYVYVFPSKLAAWLSERNSFIFFGIISVIIYAFLIMTFWPMLIVDTETIHQWALEYDPFLETFFPEPSFFLIPHLFLDRVVPALLFFISLVIIVSIAFSIYFIRLILKHQTQTTTRLQKSLIVSSVMQIYLTNIFLNLPVLAFFVFIAFDVPHSASAMCCFMTILMAHCLVEFIATFYFISPYRNFILKFFKHPISYRVNSKTDVKPVSISIMPSIA